MDNIKNNADHKIALKRIQALMKSNPTENSVAYKEMDTLVSLIESYEEMISPMITSDSSEYMKYKSQNGIRQRDLE